MLYKYPAKQKTAQNYMHGDNFETIVVTEDEVQEKIEDGWAESPSQAVDHHVYIEEGKNRKPEPKKPTRKPRKKKDELD